MIVATKVSHRVSSHESMPLRHGGIQWNHHHTRKDLLFLGKQECQDVPELCWCFNQTLRHGGTFLDLAISDGALSHRPMNSGGQQKVDFIAGFTGHKTSNFFVILKADECPTKHWCDRLVWCH